ncbi:MAG: hypothetical protein JWR32_5037 [Mycobacterium sp.]|nr:hypothetical protein [Mycobacterium sp.]
MASTSQPTFNDQMGSSTGDLILVNLHCYPKPASANNPGYSAANNRPAPSAVRDAVGAQQAQSEADGTANQG